MGNSRRPVSWSPERLKTVAEEMVPVINITALDDPIGVVHIPVELAEDRYSSAIFWTIERASAESVEYFNITSNRIEIAIFASNDLIDAEWKEVVEREPTVRVSGNWRVFEINSGDVNDDDLDSGNYDSPHLRHVSAPLAKANITILYQSSYHADFLLVKETDFKRASSVFQVQGWIVNPTSNPSPRSSIYALPLSPLSPSHYPRKPNVRPLDNLSSSSNQSTPTFAQSILSISQSSLSSRHPTPAPSPAPPISPHLCLLPSPLAVVGFHGSSHNFALHTAKIQKFVTWPERSIDSASASSPDRKALASGRPFISYTRTQDGASLATDVRAIRTMFEDTEGVLCGEEIGKAWESEAESDMEVESEVDAYEDEAERAVGRDERFNDHAKRKEDQHAFNSDDMFGDTWEEDEDDVDTPRAVMENNQHPWPHTPLQSRIVSATSPSYKPASPISPLSPRSTASRQRASRTGHHRSTSDPLHQAADAKFLPHSPGGTSKPHLENGSRPSKPTHRHTTTNVPMTMSGLACSLGSPSTPISETQFGSGTLGLSGTRKGGEKRKGRKRCLQIDLSGVDPRDEEEDGTYHLDKSGLVTRFSTLLQQNNIRMLYSSTFHTANILVEAQDVRLARKLLAPSPSPALVPAPIRV